MNTKQISFLVLLAVFSSCRNTEETKANIEIADSTITTPLIQDSQKVADKTAFLHGIDITKYQGGETVLMDLKKIV